MCQDCSGCKWWPFRPHHRLVGQCSRLRLVVIDDGGLDSRRKREGRWTFTARIACLEAKKRLHLAGEDVEEMSDGDFGQILAEALPPWGRDCRKSRLRTGGYYPWNAPLGILSLGYALRDNLFWDNYVSLRRMSPRRTKQAISTQGVRHIRSAASPPIPRL